MTLLTPFRFRAAVFDLDGTLADNMALHAEAFDEFVRQHGLPALTRDIRRRIDGRRNSEIFPLLFGRTMERDEVKRLEHEKEGAYRRLSLGRLRPLAGAVTLLDRLAARGIPAAVATSAPEPNVAHTLAELGLANRFRTVVRSDQVARGKPAPDVYLRAAEVLGVSPAECLAFEDAPVGVTAARTAGMRCVAVTSTFTAEDFAAADPPPTETYADFDAFLSGSGGWLLDEMMNASAR
jgi:HAD superfamily hydrolase (TIGR01509 family)